MTTALTHTDIDPATILRRYEQGEELVDIAKSFKCSTHKLTAVLSSKYDGDRLDAAQTANAEAAIERAVDAVRQCTDKDQAVELAAAKVVLETRKWLAERRTKQYRPPQVKAPASVGIAPLTINIVGMSGAALRSGITVEHAG